MDKHIEPNLNEIRKQQRKGKNVYVETETGTHLTGNVYQEGEDVYAATTVGIRKVLGAKISHPNKKFY
jgi:hypothetical protein